ncbi:MULTISPECIES: hypothetical protein [Roseovarius]|uniref:hypothetical protein n=1 Tax=Roseovarius TaxID=74030 RepID=UPI001C9783C0|nr:hypothetical protein [Roseovarius atlanticus]MBY5989831.1 hypothetical protein [Roseovarius atlanticus]MBY6126376.1 hypothetical protein [Roseovarius atlanticus]MBY6150870.1 hypothetical protein [Roseovarius atlanticus]
MSFSLEDVFKEVPQQTGNGGRYLTPSSVFKDAPVAPVTRLDKTTAAAREILDAQANERVQKSARLKLAREARDAGLSR